MGGDKPRPYISMSQAAQRRGLSPPFIFDGGVLNPADQVGIYEMNVFSNPHVHHLTHKSQSLNPALPSDKKRRPSHGRPGAGNL
jgi:hypothetical protein